VGVSAYVDELRTQSARVFAANPGVSYLWRDDALVFPSSTADGFEIAIQPEAGGVVVFTDVGLHVHLDGTPDQAVEDAFGLARDLLSPDMRIRELCASGRGYRWVLERRDSTGWHCEGRTGLFLWNYFGRRSERVYQNQHLPGRLAGAPQEVTGGPTRG
jgi:hypothetical protein